MADSNQDNEGNADGVAPVPDPAVVDGTILEVNEDGHGQERDNESHDDGNHTHTEGGDGDNHDNDEDGDEGHHPDDGGEPSPDRRNPADDEEVNLEGTPRRTAVVLAKAQDGSDISGDTTDADTDVRRDETALLSEILEYQKEQGALMSTFRTAIVRLAERVTTLEDPSDNSRKRDEQPSLGQKTDTLEELEEQQKATNRGYILDMGLGPREPFERAQHAHRRLAFETQQK